MTDPDGPSPSTADRHAAADPGAAAPPQEAGATPSESAAPPDSSADAGEAGGATDEPHPWSETDRPRGLDAWFAPGGEDDAPPERVADERRLIRLLAIMLALLIGVPLLLTVIAFAIELTAGRG